MSYKHSRRNKVLNYFSLMFRKRMRGDDAADDADDPDEKKLKGAKAKKGRIILMFSLYIYFTTFV